MSEQENYIFSNTTNCLVSQELLNAVHTQCVCVCGGCVLVCDPLKTMLKMIQEFLSKFNETVNIDTEWTVEKEVGD